MKYKEIFFRSLGTNIQIKILGKKASDLLSKCKNIVEYYHNKFSIYEPSSELYQINASGGKEKVDKAILELIKIGLAHSLEKDSNLNIAIGPLVKLWDIRPESKNLPSHESVTKALNASRPDQIMLDDSSIRFNIEGMSLDLGALAKGYIADKLVEFLLLNNVSSALINLGGNISTISYNHEKNAPWKIGIREPFADRSTQLMQVAISDLSVVTSGIFERFTKIDNKIYHHILDPRTGYPVKSDMLSLTIISKNALDGEIWSSKLFGMPFGLIEKSAKTNNFMALAIYKDKEIKYSEDLEEYISWRKI